jgi:hypothetical protein
VVRRRRKKPCANNLAGAGALIKRLGPRVVHHVGCETTGRPQRLCEAARTCWSWEFKSSGLRPSDAPRAATTKGTNHAGCWPGRLLGCPGPLVSAAESKYSNELISKLVSIFTDVEERR